MISKLGRRGFLGFLGGAAAAGPGLAKAAADSTILKHAGFPMGSEVAGATPLAPIVAPTGITRRVVRWLRKTGIPAWKMHEIRRQANYERNWGLDPDLACLRSVSAGWKAREQRRRNLERLIEQSLASINKDGDRRDFHERVLAKFGTDLSWYD